MFSSEYGEAIVEVLDILNNTKKEDVDKIPARFIEFLKNNADTNYKANLDHSKPISELNLMDKTKEILGLIYINWWCDNEDYEKYMNQLKNMRKIEAEQNDSIQKCEENKESENVAKAEATATNKKVNNNPGPVDSDKMLIVLQPKKSFFKTLAQGISNIFNRKSKRVRVK